MHRKQNNQGFTIVELMVALLIGLLLLGGLIQIFIVTRSNYRVQQSVNYMQENLRFASAELTYGVRMGGFFHTVAEPAAIEPGPDGIYAATATGTGNARVASNLVILPGTTATPGCGLADWAVGVQGFEGGATDPTSGCLNATNYLPDTDVVALTYLRPVFMGLPALGARPASPALDPLGVYALIEDLKFKERSLNFAGYIGRGSSFAPAEIERVLLFNPNDSGDADGIRKNGLAPMNRIKRTAAMMPLTVELYYVRRCSVLNAAGVCDANSDGGNPQPTLVRRTRQSNGAMLDEPIVDGIEHLQIEYLASGCATYMSATTVTSWTGCSGTYTLGRRWQRVMSVRMSLLARSSEFEISLNDTGPYNLSTDTPTYNPATRNTILPNNARYRRVLRTIYAQPRNAIRPLPSII
jgi:type IV pilus assembly protein PilW